MFLRVLTRRVRRYQGPSPPRVHHAQRRTATVQSTDVGHRRFSFTETDPHVVPGAPNKRVSVDPQGHELTKLEFQEEPLGLTRDQGHGYLRVSFGEAIGPDERYQVVRKLGWGMHGSVWMAYDRKAKKYVAVKALKGHMTDLFNKGVAWELPAWQRLASTPPAPGVEPGHIPPLLAHFIHRGREQDGEHLCFVTDVMGGDVKRLQIEGAKQKPFPLSLAKRILLHTLHGLAHMHHCEFVHTSLASDNIMFDVGSAEIVALIEGDPPRLHPREESWKGTVQAAVTQPLPLPPMVGATIRTYLLSDFSRAQPFGNHTLDVLTAPPLRAPEILLQGPWGKKIDIWAFGCLIYELVTAHALFEIGPRPQAGLDKSTAHLWQMLCTTQERIPREMIEKSQLGPHYFNLPCNPEELYCDLKVDMAVEANPFRALLKRHRILNDEDLSSTAKIMQRCLRLDPKERATAQELLQDPWWQGAA
ncbi:putative kinase-like protein [Lyophyllum shimeji]|uniref:Kinase-like protein n=1 Tax=Lyophyllum shimeji TaxID=47721 RepID=A0A9P3PFE2_LYOSH|nr:putative kinase-like protein [Lyophyllum shimeji]